MSVVLCVIVAGVLVPASPASADAGFQHNANNCLLTMFESTIGSLAETSDGCDVVNNVYKGRVKDDMQPSGGHCVKAVLQGITMAVSCDSAGFGFTYTDPDANFSATTQVWLSDNSAFIGAPFNVNF